MASIVWPWWPMSSPRSSPSPTNSACSPSASSRTSMPASTPAASTIRSISSRARSAAVSWLGDISYLRRPDRFFFLRGDFGGGPPRAPEATGCLAGSGSLGLRIKPPRPPPPPDPLGPDFGGPPPSDLPPPLPLPPPPAGGGPPAVTGRVGPIVRLTTYCWPIVHRLVVIQ